ncbi:MAG TPA: hypothetical protein PLP20_00740 [Oscillospiraceae bacterium]|nr:hypothetical protein [Oscillospiraceae bacterium]HNW04196.1 hypothetical protein [Oscillospiraceae bacterium]HPV99570.1 hypothetical protein [Oscillospiraceae bacterium]
MTRLTQKIDGRYVAKDPEAAAQKLGRTEDLYESMLAERDGLCEKIARLRAEDKTKSASFRQFLGEKLMLETLLARFRIWDAD